jgi:hypothetical protein
MRQFRLVLEVVYLTSRPIYLPRPAEPNFFNIC